MRTRILFASIAILVFSSTAARADEAPAGVREHDGFYARFGIGPGFTFGSNKADGADVKADVSGVEISTEIAIGTTIAPGLVVGGGEFSMIVPSPKYAIGDNSSTAGAHHISGIGPFVDYYFQPRGGLHAQLGLLFSAGYLTAKDTRESGVGLGFGAMLGGGYEIFIGDQWSVGPIVRLTYYNQSVEGSDSKAKSRLSLVAPSLLVGVTYH